MGVEQLAQLYIQEIVRLHGVPVSIVSDRDSRFMSNFWKAVQSELGTQLNFSTAYHPQTDGQTERVNQILEDMLRACVQDFGGNWDEYLSLAEFSYNNSYQASIGMAPYEAFYGRRCRSPVCWLEVGEKQLVRTDLVDKVTQQIEIVRKNMKAAQDRQKKYADHRTRPLEFVEGDLVYLRATPIRPAFRHQRRGKLGPRYLGPYRIKDRVGQLAYRLELPEALIGLHDVFHVS